MTKHKDGSEGKAQGGNCVLFLGGHQNGGASIDWPHYFGNFATSEDARNAIPVGLYYTILDENSGAIVERGCRDGDGNFVPVKEPL